jgi:hypothetical protein
MALEYARKPYNPYGKTVNNLPLPTEEGDDKKRNTQSQSTMTTRNKPPNQTTQPMTTKRNTPRPFLQQTNKIHRIAQPKPQTTTCLEVTNFTQRGIQGEDDASAVG